VLAEGLTWEWESFSDFLDALERRPHAIDVAAQVAHLPLRVYVMGDRAVRLEAARTDDIAEMRRLTIEALRAGAFGFTTSRINSHKTPAGGMVPSRNAEADELLGIGSALGVLIVELYLHAVPPQRAWGLVRRKRRRDEPMKMGGR
jgi:N-acyl-D-amino-acid deacylase